MAEGTAGQRPGAQTPAIEDPIGGNTRMLEQIGVVMKQFVIEIGLGDGLEILVGEAPAIFVDDRVTGRVHRDVEAHLAPVGMRSEEHTSELQSLMRISYAVFCLKKKTNIIKNII